MSELPGLEELIQRWKRDGVELLPPHSEQEVIRALSLLGRPFSRDIVNLYCTTGGMVDGLWDDAGLTLWPLEQIVQDNLNNPRPQILFMDFLINSYCYGLQYNDAEISSVYIDYFGKHPPQRVAESLNEFFRLYLTDHVKLIVW